MAAKTHHLNQSIKTRYWVEKKGKRQKLSKILIHILLFEMLSSGMRLARGGAVSCSDRAHAGLALRGDDQGSAGALGVQNGMVFSAS